MSDLMARQEPDGWQEPPREHHFAGFWIRVAASCWTPVSGRRQPARVQSAAARHGRIRRLFSLIDLMEALFGLLYMILLTWWTGQTLGKLITGIRVISARQSRGNLSGGQVILREVIGKFLSTLPFGLGYLWVAWNPQKQGWHDLLAKTYVVYDRKT